MLIKQTIKSRKILPIPAERFSLECNTSSQFWLKCQAFLNILMQVLPILKVVKGIISRVYSVHHLVYSHLPHLWNGDHKRPKLTSFAAIKGIKCVIYLEISKVYEEVCVCVSRSVVSNSLQPHGCSPPGKNTGVGCHFLFHIKE